MTSIPLDIHRWWTNTETFVQQCTCIPIKKGRRYCNAPPCTEGWEASINMAAFIVHLVLAFMQFKEFR